MEIKGFVFDLDGVLVDTAILHYQAWKALSDELGLQFDERLNEKLKGVSRSASFQIILSANGVDYPDADKECFIARKNAIYVSLLDALDESWVLPGMHALLLDAQRHSLRLALASASRNAPMVLAKTGIAHFFDYVADAGAIKHPKPAPDIFALCAKSLAIQPSACLGFEDSAAGIAAIKSAGMKSVGIGASARDADYWYEHTSSLGYDALLCALH